MLLVLRSKLIEHGPAIRGYSKIGRFTEQFDAFLNAIYCCIIFKKRANNMQ